MTEYNSGDQVALAVDDPEARWNMGHQVMRCAAPLSDTFYKNCLASGAITPPLGESAAVRRSDWWTGICVLCFLALGVAAFCVAMWWR